MLRVINYAIIDNKCSLRREAIKVYHITIRLHPYTLTEEN